MQVDVDRVEANDEVDEGILLGRGDVRKESCRNRLTRRERRADGKAECERLSVDITNVDTAFVGKEDLVALTLGVDADAVLGVGRVREEGLEDEVVESACDCLDLETKRHLALRTS